MLNDIELWISNTDQHTWPLFTSLERLAVYDADLSSNTDRQLHHCLRRLPNSLDMPALAVEYQSPSYLSASSVFVALNENWPSVRKLKELVIPKLEAPYPEDDGFQHFHAQPRGDRAWNHRHRQVV